MRWHRWRAAPNNYFFRFVIALLLFGIFFVLPDRPKVQSAPERDSLGYVVNGGRWAVVPHLQKPKRWRSLTSEWPLCIATVATDLHNLRSQLDSFLSVWPGWLSITIFGSTITIVQDIVKNVSIDNLNIIDQVSFHAIHPLGPDLDRPPPTLLLQVAISNSPCDWVALVEDVGLRPPPDDGPQSPMEAVLARLSEENAPDCFRVAQYEVSKVQRLPTSVQEIAVYREFGILKKTEGAEVVIAKQGAALRGECNGTLDKQLFFARVVQDAQESAQNCSV